MIAKTVISSTISPVLMARFGAVVVGRQFGTAGRLTPGYRAGLATILSGSFPEHGLDTIWSPQYLKGKWEQNAFPGLGRDSRLNVIKNAVRNVASLHIQVL